MNISEKTLKALQKAGWYEGREIDIGKIKFNLEKLGYTVFEPAQKFLKEFGMLIVEDLEMQRVHDTTIVLTDTYDSHIGFRQIEMYAGELLCLVGEVCNGYLRMFVSESGKIYHETGKLGDNGLEAWERLFSGKGAISWGGF